MVMFFSHVDSTGQQRRRLLELFESARTAPLPSQCDCNNGVEGQHSSQIGATRHGSYSIPYLHLTLWRTQDLRDLMSQNGDRNGTAEGAPMEMESPNSFLDFINTIDDFLSSATNKDA